MIVTPLRATSMAWWFARSYPHKIWHIKTTDTVAIAKFDFLDFIWTV
jgi:hypothetical protein